MKLVAVHRRTRSSPTTFPKARRGTAFAIYALAVPVGTSIGAAIGGWGNQNLGWRNTFIAIGLPGVVLAVIVFFTVKEPPRGMSDGAARKGQIRRHPA